MKGWIDPSGCMPNGSAIDARLAIPRGVKPPAMTGKGPAILA